MGDDLPVLRLTWSNRLAGTYGAASLAVALVVIALAWIDGWLQILLVTLGASIAIRTILRWVLRSVRVREDEIVYREDLRRVPVPFVGVAAFTTRNLGSRRNGRGVAVLPDRPLPSLPARLVTAASAERFEAWLVRNHPDIAINPTGTWQDRFGDWHVDEDGIDPQGMLTIGLRPLQVGDSFVEIEAVDGGFRALRRDRASGDVRDIGDVRPHRRDAVADGVDLYRRAVPETT